MRLEASRSSPLLRPRLKESALMSLTQSLRSASSSIRLRAAPPVREERKRVLMGTAAPFPGGMGCGRERESARRAAEKEPAAARRRKPSR